MEKCPTGADPQTCGVDPKSCSGCDPAQREEAKTQEEQKLARALKQMGHKLLVMSGKGGVGKSSVAVSLALALARRGHRVGLMDVDLHGPDVLRMLGLKEPLDLEHAQFHLPPELFDNLKIISIEAVMKNRELAVIWRGPLKHQLIRQFLTEVQWGALDYLVIDAPPGTGDEPMSVAQTVPEAQAVIVTTPQEISLADVRKSINFCQKVNLGILGLVENMSGYACPHCGEKLPLFKQGGGEKTARAAKIPFLGAIPFDPKVVEAADQGQLLELAEADSPFLSALAPMVSYLVEVLPPTGGKPVREPGVWKFAAPVEDGKLSAVFAQAGQFALFTVKEGAVQAQETLATPRPEEEALPNWLEVLGVTHVLAVDLREAARALLKRKGMEVVAAAAGDAPAQLVGKYLQEAAAGARQCTTA